MIQGISQFTDLPDDLYAIIVDLVAAVDEEEFGDVDFYPGLSALSLVGCKRLVPFCRSYIFRVVKIRSFKEQGRTSKELQDFIEVAPDIAHFITELHWNVNFFEAWRGTSYDEPHYHGFLKLDRVKSLVIRGEHNPIKFHDVPNIAKVFDHFLRLPTLTSLSLDFVRDVSITDISRRSPSIRTLLLEDVVLIPDRLDTSSTSVAIEKLSIVATRMYKDVNDNTDVFTVLPRLQSATLSMAYLRGHSMAKALLHRCSRTLRHLKVVSRGAPVDDPFFGIASNLQSIKGANALESISISIPFHSDSPGSENAWQALDRTFSNTAADFPHLRHVYIQIASSSYQAPSSTPVRNYWMHYDNCLTELQNSKEICFILSLDYVALGGRILSSNAKMTGL